MGAFRRAVRAMKHVAKLIASGICNKWEALSLAVVRIFKKAAARAKKLLAIIYWKALLHLLYIKYLAMVTWNYTRYHPYQTSFIVISVLTITFAPIALSLFLAAAGFTDIGPAAGTIAAAVQSATSPIVAGSTFAVLQSAAMSGYGAPIVIGSMRTIAAAGLVIMALWNFFGNNDVDNNDKDT